MSIIDADKGDIEYIGYDKDALRLYSDYLKSYKNLSARERNCYCDIFDILSRPLIRVNCEKINPEDLVIQAKEAK